MVRKRREASSGDSKHLAPPEPCSGGSNALSALRERETDPRPHETAALPLSVARPVGPAGLRVHQNFFSPYIEIIR